MTTGRGDPRAALARLGYWTWDTEELLSLLHWMREHNLRAGDLPPLRFFGMDMQDPQLAIADVLTFLRREAPAEEKGAREAYDCLGPLQTMEEVTRIYQEYRQRDPARQLACESAIGGVQERLNPVLARAGKSRESERARTGARLVSQFERYLRMRSLRDRFMAENVASLLAEAGPAGKAVLWTHNGHAVNRPGSLGGGLKKRFGPRALLVGMTFQGGTFRAVEQDAEGRYGGIRSLRAPELPADGLERHLSQAAGRAALFDLRPASGPSPLHGSLPMRRIGASFAPSRPEASFTPVRLAEDFDLLAYVAESSPTRGCCTAGRGR